MRCAAHAVPPVLCCLCWPRGKIAAVPCLVASPYSAPPAIAYLRLVDMLTALAGVVHSWDPKAC